MAPADLRVLIIEDHALFAEALGLALVTEGCTIAQITVADASRWPAGVLAQAIRWRPRIVLLDLELGGVGDGAVLIEPLTRAGADVVVVTASADRVRWGGCVRRGARAVLCKSRPLGEILSTVRRLGDGELVMTREERLDLVGRWRREGQEREALGTHFARLTHRERQVLAQLAAGRSVREIAAADVVSEATVRSQVRSILAKLEVSSQLAAAGQAHRLGWYLEA